MGAVCGGRVLRDSGRYAQRARFRGLPTLIRLEFPFADVLSSSTMLGLYVEGVDNAQKKNRQHNTSANNMHATNECTLDVLNCEELL